MAAFATTKGLNQIVTPDIQPFGQLSISYQMQNAVIGNPYQIQYEYGFTKNLEAAVFQGMDPGELYGAAEYGIIQRPDFLLSTGFLGWSTRGDAPQPFLEAGWMKAKGRLIAGIQRTGRGEHWDFGGRRIRPRPHCCFKPIIWGAGGTSRRLDSPIRQRGI